MSGIYIPGMEMPTTGLFLVSVDSSCGKDETVMTVKRMLGNRDVCLIIGAYNLIPVPDHKGPLVDALEVINTFPDGFIFTGEQARALTNYIIPADREDSE